MKIFNNVLSKQLLEDIQSECSAQHFEYNWGSSLSWTPQLLEGISGSCLFCKITGETRKRILKEIKPLLPEVRHYLMQYFVWQQNSGIALHDDTGKAFGATIYLNTEWFFQNGGIFLYKDMNKSEDPEWTALLPEHNTMVLNDSHEFHMVTPVSPYTSNLRYTIQIWGIDDPEFVYEE